MEISEKNIFEIYNIDMYSKSCDTFILNNKIIVNDKKELCKMLNTKKGYHFRIHKNTQYIFFGDIDNYTKNIECFINILQEFMKETYDLVFTMEDFKYTQNNENKNSYHYSIPKFNASTEKLKEIHELLLKKYHDEFTYVSKNNTIKKIVDTSIFSEHWYRCPNQKKGTSIDDKSMHIIVKGTMKDFIITNIPVKSVNINNILQKNIKSDIIVTQNKKKYINVDEDDLMVVSGKNEDQSIITSSNEPKKIALTMTMTQPIIYKKMFDECYKQERFDLYENWISVGMAIKNTFSDDPTAFDLFDYFSAKGNNYEGTAKTKQKFTTLIKKKTNKKYTVATIYYYAITDNKPKCIEIINKNTYDLEQYDMCNYAKLMAGDRFIYIKNNDVYKLYCFNGKLWVNDSVLFKNFLSTELYEFLKMILVELYFESPSFNQMRTQIKRLKTANFKKEIVESYKEVNTNSTLKFDDKWYLFGFNNVVYDLELGSFREYKYDDYVSTTTGYDWRDPTEEELATMKTLIKEIMPNSEERQLYLEILATTLDGKCLEKFVVFNGLGGNGKGVTDDLLLIALGNYGMIGNNSILFESNKTGSNPEKANMHKKRLVLFREPPENKKFENAIIKELTGGGTYSCRGHHESNTTKELNLTMIIECNKKPLFSEEPTDADVRRIIDVYFRSTYTTDKTIVDPENNIYLANPYYKTSEFQHKHKYALLHILMNVYKTYKSNNSILQIPQSIELRTKSYLELSCNIIQWFKDNYEFTGAKTDICKMKDLYSDFTTGEYYVNMNKQDRRKYNKSFFVDYVEKNIFFRKYYHERFDNIRTCIVGWRQKIDNDE